MTKRIDPELSAAFTAGLTGQPAQGVKTSSVWEAWAVGQHLHLVHADPDCQLVSQRGSTCIVESFSGRFAYRVKYSAQGVYSVSGHEV